MTRLVALAVLLVLVAGCGGADPGTASSQPSVGTAAAASPVPPARIGTPAPGQRVRFVPTSIELPGGSRAPVLPASTVDGELVVPEEVQRVGWWDGGAQAGDPFGSLVIAGHIDSATQGLGFFVRLLQLKVGDKVSLRAGRQRAVYVVVGVRSVPKDALATETFDQTGDHRLVLITCTGRYDPARGGYQRNLVVTAAPVWTGQD